MVITHDVCRYSTDNGQGRDCLTHYFGKGGDVGNIDSSSKASNRDNANAANSVDIAGKKSAEQKDGWMTFGSWIGGIFGASSGGSNTMHGKIGADNNTIGGSSTTSTGVNSVTAIEGSLVIMNPHLQVSSACLSCIVPTARHLYSYRPLPPFYDQPSLTGDEGH